MKQIPNDFFFSWVEKEIAEGRNVRFRLKGNSMFPLLRDGRDVVVLYPCTGDELRPMDVVLFRYRGNHLLHRIIRRNDKYFLMQGDGSLVAKEECLASDIVGKVHHVIRLSGKVVPVESWKWRFLSRLWRGLGILRAPCLRVLHKLFLT